MDEQFSDTNEKMTHKTQYAMWGAGFGLSFPIIATAVAAWTSGVSVVDAQLTEPLLWIIDSAPIFLGMFASVAGANHDRVEAALHDIERKASELEMANAELVEARNLKSQFLANVSHELRTPLNAIIGFSRILRRKAKGKLDDKQLTNIDRIHDSGIQLRDLVNDLLDIERIEAGMLAVHDSEFDVISLAEELIATVKQRAREKGLKLEFEASPEVRVLSTDPNRLRQLMTNLLVNAVKYSDDGTIALRLEKADGRLLISVEDGGIGIPADALPHIFEPFRQVDGSSTRSHGGVGLGLNLVKQLCERLGGTVSVESEVGRGSTFTLSFADTMIVSSDSQAIEERSEEIMPTTGDGEGPLVLVIDDDDRALDIASVELSEAGYRAHVANSGARGVELARSLRPDVIVLDIIMPGMDGWSVLQVLREDPSTSEIPVIVASFLDKVAKSGGMNIRGWMNKPFTMANFRSFVSTMSAKKIEEVLVVEDDPATLALIVQHLEATGVRIRTAEDGPSALQALEVHMPNAVVLDLMIPQIDGTHVLQKLRELEGGKDLPVVVYTAKTLSDDERLALSGGVVEVVRKSDDHSVEHVVELITDAVKSEATEQ
jgi:signal transduction histidine kinase/CheY-like chemotaxis protein